MPSPPPTARPMPPATLPIKPIRLENPEATELMLDVSVLKPGMTLPIALDSWLKLLTSPVRLPAAPEVAAVLGTPILPAAIPAAS